MRLSRVLLAGAAVAAAGIATSAFTTSNDVQESVAGYGKETVSGVTTSDIKYVLDASKTQVTEINFKVTEDLDPATYADVAAFLQLAETDGTLVGGPQACVIGTFSVDHTPINCNITDVLVDGFDSIALTVAE
jgi:hypothetical protein